MFGNKAKPTIVYRYDVRAKQTPCLNNIGFVREQLGLARHFRNMLIEAELAGRTAYREARSAAYPDYAELEAEGKAAKEAVEKIIAAMSKENALQKRKRATKEERDRKAEAVAVRKAAFAKLKARRAEISGDATLSDAADMARDDLTDKAHEWANEAGLYQGTKWAAARAVFQSCRTSKEDPRFSRWDGTGRLSLQLQAQKPVMDRKGPPTFANIALGRWDSHLSFRREGKWTIFSIRFGKLGVVECPVVLHRDWPEDAVCKWVELVCTRTGRDYQYSLCFSLAREDGWDKPTAADGAVGIDMGWRLVKDGLRVACWSGDDGEEGELVIPHARMDYYTKPRDLASIRDTRADDMKPILTAHIKSLSEIPEEIAEAVKHLHAIKSKSKLLAIVNALPGNLPVALVEWRRKEVHLERYESDQRAKFERWRKDFYRCFWARMRERYSVAYIEKINRTPHKPGPDEASIDAMTTWRACASNGLLAQFGDGFAITVDAKGITKTCSVCGSVEDVDHKDLLHTCVNGHEWDRDYNAARNLLARGEVLHGSLGAARV